jgi:hypothetical protein
VPYVNHSEETPDRGWVQFWDSPRYSSGYATLWNTFAFVPETHMLKPYAQRVHATRALLQSFIEFIGIHHHEMKKLRSQAKQQQQVQDSFTISWRRDRTKWTPIRLKGYEAGYKKSEISGLNRLFYDHTKPIDKMVPFYNSYVDSIRVATPKAYLIPQGWWKVIERLQANGVHMQRLRNDTVVEVEAYRIESYQTFSKPYEGHHLNHSVQVSKTRKKMSFRKGDYLIPLNHVANRFLVETLEPQAEDSYFAWNFFDAILQQKEGFSDYVFEETAQTFLKTHAGVRQQLEARRQSDTAFANSAAAQLGFCLQAVALLRTTPPVVSRVQTGQVIAMVYQTKNRFTMEQPVTITRSSTQVKQMERLAKLMDAQFRIPGTDFRFGLDGLLGLIPGAGDLSTFAVSGYMVLILAKNGASGFVLARMILNILIDATIGSIPLIGDLFDFAFKANTRNMRLMKEHYVEGRHKGSALKVIVPVLILVLLAIIGLIWLMYKLLAYLF